MSLIPVPLHHDGADLVGLLALPEGPGPHPAVLVMHNAHGLSAHMGERAEALAALGYVALATDLYGGGLHFAQAADAGAPYLKLNERPGRMRERTVTWYEHLRARPDVDPARVGAIGYCLGGQCVLELVRSGADVKTVVSYHGLLTTDAPALPDSTTATVAIYTGALDPYAPAADVAAVQAELAAAGARVHLTVFSDAEHSFTDPAADAMGRPGIAYNALAQAVSWAGTGALLAATIGSNIGARQTA